MQVTLVSKVLDVLLMVALAYMPVDSKNRWVTLALVAVQLTRGVCPPRPPPPPPGPPTHIAAVRFACTTA